MNPKTTTNAAPPPDPAKLTETIVADDREFKDIHDRVKAILAEAPRIREAIDTIYRWYVEEAGHDDMSAEYVDAVQGLHRIVEEAECIERKSESDGVAIWRNAWLSFGPFAEQAKQRARIGELTAAMEKAPAGDARAKRSPVSRSGTQVTKRDALAAEGLSRKDAAECLTVVKKAKRTAAKRRAA